LYVLTVTETYWRNPAGGTKDYFVFRTHYVVCEWSHACVEVNESNAFTSTDIRAAELSYGQKLAELHIFCVLTSQLPSNAPWSDE